MGRPKRAAHDCKAEILWLISPKGDHLKNCLAQCGFTLLAFFNLDKNDADSSEVAVWRVEKVP